MDNIVLYVLLGIVGLIVIITFFSSFFSVKTQTSAVVEKFGKFSRIAGPGLNFKLPFVETSQTVSLVTYQLDGELETKTKDNVFVKLPVKVQYQVINNPDSIKNAYYKLANPKTQIESYLYNILLGHIPETTLDDLFLSQPQIAQRATDELSIQMKDFGYEIVKVLITDIIPDDGVKAAMNRINEQTRLGVANKAQGDAEYILKTRQAEADAEVKHQEGLGIAMEREAIADGWKASIEKIKEGTLLTDSDATDLLLFTNYTDMLAKVGTSENTTMVFIPSGPDAVQNFHQTMANVQLSALTHNK